MQQIYTHSNEHFQVFTTVMAPHGRCRYRAEKMVVVHSYRPHWPDELDLSPGDVILVLSGHEEERWLGRMQDGRQGYFPPSCVMELSQLRSLRMRVSVWDDSGVRIRYGHGHILQPLRRGSRGVGGGMVLDGGQGKNEGPFVLHRPQTPVPQTQRSPSLLHRILSKCRKKSEYQGATNEAFEGD